MKAIKWIIGTIAALALLVAIAVAYIVFAIDPNNYKPQLTELAKEQDIALNIEGELSWQLLPSLALSIGTTQITSPRSEIPDISFEQADLSLAWLPLFQRQLSVKAISLEGADIHLGSAEQAINTTIAPLAAAPLPLKSLMLLSKRQMPPKHPLLLRWPLNASKSLIVVCSYRQLLIPQARSN